jgi:hypothetical protein
MLEIKFFDIPGRADVVRTLSHAANVSWKDTRISMEDWPPIKPIIGLRSHLDCGRDRVLPDCIHAVLHCELGWFVPQG